MTPGNDSVSIVIRNRNEGHLLKKVLHALELQRFPKPEIVLVDNESTDGSREIASQYGAKILNISTSDFSYGRALNLGIQSTTGSIIVLLSAHSLPMGRDFPREAVAPFEDPKVAAVRCIMVTNSRDVES